MGTLKDPIITRFGPIAVESYLGPPISPVQRVPSLHAVLETFLVVHSLHRTSLHCSCPLTPFY